MPSDSYRELSPSQKEDAILRYLRGENPSNIAAEMNIAPERLEAWRRRFLEGGRAALMQRTDKDSVRAQKLRNQVLQWIGLVIVLLGVTYLLVSFLSRTTPPG